MSFALSRVSIDGMWMFSAALSVRVDGFALQIGLGPIGVLGLAVLW